MARRWASNWWLDMVLWIDSLSQGGAGGGVGRFLVRQPTALPRGPWK